MLLRPQLGGGQSTVVSLSRNLGIAHPTGIMLSTSAFVMVAHHSISSERSTSTTSNPMGDKTPKCTSTETDRGW